MHKYYQCLVAGQVRNEQSIQGYLEKDPKTNKVRIQNCEGEETAYIETKYRPLQVFSDSTLLEVCLITGRSHQIRAHLASEGHPIIGDYKYGSQKINETYKKRYGLHSQLLHAGRLEMPVLEAPFEALSGQIFQAEPPVLMRKILKACADEGRMG